MITQFAYGRAVFQAFNAVEMFDMQVRWDSTAQLLILDDRDQ
jgi:hypothetical protein